MKSILFIYPNITICLKGDSNLYTIGHPPSLDLQTVFVNVLCLWGLKDTKIRHFTLETRLVSVGLEYLEPLIPLTSEVFVFRFISVK